MNSDQLAFLIPELCEALYNVLPEQALNESVLAALACDVFLSIGTSGVVEPAASLPRVALRRGARVALINPKETTLLSEKVDFLRGPAGMQLPALVQEAWPSQL